MDHWTEDMTARDRIEAVALTLRRPRSVNWIKQQAEVGSWETAKSHLDRLHEMGLLSTVEVDGSPQYVRDPMRAYLDQIHELIADNSKAELREELEAIAEEIDAWRGEYGVDSLGDLEATLGDPELALEEIRDRRTVVSAWEENHEYRRVISHALELYDDLTAHARTVDAGVANHAD